MKLKAKISLILVTAAALLFIGSFGISRSILSKNLEAIEKEEGIQRIQSTMRLIQRDLDELSGTTLDWAAWNDTYEYVLGNNPDYISVNYRPSVRENLQLDYVMLFDKNNKMLRSIHFPSDIAAIEPIPDRFVAQFIAMYGDQMLLNKELRTDNQVISIDGKPLLASSQQIMNSTRTSPVVGTLVFLREINQATIADYEKFLDFQLRFDAKPTEGSFPAAPTSSMAEIPLAACRHQLTPETIISETCLVNRNNSPVMTLTAIAPRSISTHTNAAITTFLILFAILISIITVINAALINRLIVSPIHYLGATLGRLNLEQVTAFRFSRFGEQLYGDYSEIGILGQDIDRMLDRIEQDAIQLRTSENQLKQAIEASDAGLWSYDCITQTYHMDNRLMTMLGYETDTVTADIIDYCLTDESIMSMRQWLSETIDDNRLNSNIECMAKVPSGSEHWFLVTGDVTERSSDGTALKVTGLLLDISKQKKLESELFYLSYHDKLTGLYNRRYFEKKLREFDDPRYYPLTVMIGDINGLKLTNDTFGHEEGDQLLSATARILQGSCRKNDVICRWGGDEFAILLPNSDVVIAERIYSKIKTDCSAEKVGPIYLTMALGYATCSEPGEPYSMLVKTAEERMYRNKVNESESARSGILTTIQKTLNDKSIETFEHSKRMAAFGTAIATAMELGREKIDEIVLLANLHDIGKIAIPEAILNKQGKLNQPEWEIIRNHPEVGFRIASTLQDFSHIAMGINAHHENYDGTGYPKGLRGNQIPLIARIISVSDAVDVMLHGRPYQDPADIDHVIRELERCSGTQFDPDIVTIAVAILKQRL